MNTLALTAFADAGLVDVRKLVPDAVFDVRYATPDNVFKVQLYDKPACFLLETVANRLTRAAQDLRAQGYRLKIFDCYRPLSVQKKMWAIFPVEGYVANPARGGNHNRGAAVDVSLVDLSGSGVEMPTDFDTFDKRAHAHAKNVSESAKKHRDILRDALEKQGFKVNPMEWWHFDAPEAKGAKVLDIPL